ncbi:ATP-binding protein [Streptomyces palmae]|nr:ATP-binding protein [Streptomyces palmae]
MAGLTRRFLKQLLVAEGAHETAVEAAQLCATELVANVHRHTTSPTVAVEILLTPERLVVHVHDDAPSTTLAAAARQGDEAEHGRGLGLVDTYATRWGTTVYAGRPPRRKSVWFRLDAITGAKSPL